MSVREKWDTVLACGVSRQIKTRVEERASRRGYSMADFVRLAVIAKLEAEDVGERDVA